MKTKLFFLAILFFGFFGLAGSAQAATYYIDYSTGSDINEGISKATPWKRCPGMVGFSGSYSHSNGDIFIFKGGVTWPSAALPLTIGYSGSSGNIDTYTADQSWYSGASWSQPIFDMEQTDTYGINITAKNYITINNINIIKPANQQSGDDGMIVIKSNTNLVTIQNCIVDGADGAANAIPIRLQNVDGVTIDSNYLRARQSGSGNPDCIVMNPWYKVKNITISNNELTNPDGSGGDGLHINCGLSEIAPDPADSPWYNDYANNCGPFLIENNNFHDMAGKMFIAWNGCMRNAIIRYNRFHGLQNNRTGIDFDGSADCGQSCFDFYNNQVYYNLFYDITGTVANWGGLIRMVYGDKNSSANNVIYNNIFKQAGSYPEYEIGIKFMNTNGTAWTLKNNVFYGLTTAISGGNSATIDKNGFYNDKSNGTAGTNFITSYPKFVNVESSDFHLQLDSPYTNAGIDWGQTRDMIGTSKQGPAWDIGAYEYVQESDTTPPAAPVGLTVQ